MTLRTRLLAGYLAFVVALALLGGWSAWHLRQASGLSRRIVSENYDSIVAAQDMKESLERQDSAALFALLGRHERAQAQLREHRARFDEAFTKAANNITESGEREIIEAIRRGRDEYYALFDAFSTMPRQTTSGVEALSDPDASATYFEKLEPHFRTVLADCDRLLRLNESAVLRKSAEAASLAWRWFLTTLALGLGLVGAGAGLAFVLSDRIVRPLRHLGLGGLARRNRNACRQFQPDGRAHSRAAALRSRQSPARPADDRGGHRFALRPRADHRSPREGHETEPGRRAHLRGSAPSPQQACRHRRA
jgi:hypothetical protein